MSAGVVVSTAAELVAAVASEGADVEVRGELSGMAMITLAPGVTLRGGTVRFGGKGICLTRDNVLDGVSVVTADTEVAVLNDTTVADLGTLTLRGVTVRGQVLLLAADAVRAGRVQVQGLRVLSADLRGRVDRPRGFGVEAMQGGFTLWNRQPDPAVVLTADLVDLAVGTSDTPVRGSGVFVGGHGDAAGAPDGGTVQVTRLWTGEIHTDGGIAAGTPDVISAGVFVISGAVVAEVVNTAAVTTHGPNDMVLDNWGQVDTWTAQAPVTSHGPSGIGFVNFGALDRLDVHAPIRTFGTGARGFNVYNGSLRHASFDSITTHGDGSIGVQISKPLAVLDITGDLRTEGGQGQSLVKGVQTVLTAIALSVKPAGHIGSVHIGGRVSTTGDGVVTVDLEGGVDQLRIDGGISATGSGSDAVHLTGPGPDLTGIEVTAARGDIVVRTL